MYSPVSISSEFKGKYVTELQKAAKTATTTMTSLQSSINGLADKLAGTVSATLRLANAAWMLARNAADGDDLDLLRANSSDQLEFGVQLAEPPFTNLLANPGFEYWQGGAGAFTSGRCADCWLLSLGGTSTASFSREATIIDAHSRYSGKTIYTHAAGGWGMLRSAIEPNGLEGAVLSASVRIYQTVANSVVLRITDFNGSTGESATSATSATINEWVTLTVTKTIRTGLGASGWVSGEVSFQTVSTTVYADNMMLVHGSVPQVYRPRSLAVDIPMLFRYRIKLGGNSNYEKLGSGMATSATNCYVFCPFPVKMMKTPGLTLMNVSSFLLYHPGGNIAVTNVSMDQWGANGTSVAVTVASGLGVGTIYTLMANNSTAPGLLFDAMPD